MVLSKMQRLKVILLLSGYLYMALIHLQYVEQPRAVANQAVTIAHMIPKGYDKSGHVVPIVKKIYKTVINRKLVKNQVLQHLYATTLLFDHGVNSVASLKLSPYTSPVSALQVKRCFYLRI